jgi:hypothetical protein
MVSVEKLASFILIASFNQFRRLWRGGADRVSDIQSKPSGENHLAVSNCVSAATAPPAHPPIPWI